MSCALQGAFLVCGTRLVLRGEMPGGRLMAVMLYQSQLCECFQSLMNTVSSLFKSSGASAKVFQLLDRRPLHTRQAAVAAPAATSARRPAAFCPAPAPAPPCPVRFRPLRPALCSPVRVLPSGHAGARGL